MVEQSDAAIVLRINGAPRTTFAAPSTPLVRVLRDEMGLRGAKVGCGQGECGACSVMLEGVLVCSCLTALGQVDGRQVTTVEGLAGDRGLHPIQQAFIDHGALQCGFCTSGMLMAAHALLQSNPDPSEEDVVAGLTGNICRCTGYRKIIEAVLDAAARIRNER